MGNKSALHISDIKSDAASSAGSPFWAPKNAKKKITAKKVFKQIWRWTKIAIFLFMMLMGLWGCFQSMWDPRIAQNSTLGAGMEYGFAFGTTGDFRFDLQMSADATQYNTFTNFTFAYGPFYAFFVWPAAFVTTKFMYVTRNWWGGLNTFIAIFLLLLVIRLLTMAMTLKSQFQNEKMSEVQTQIAEINAKYAGMNDAASKQMKQQETMALYNKHGIKPFAAFEQMFLTLPIFLIVYRVVTIVRPIKATILFNIWNFAASPLSQIFSNFVNGGWTYIFFLIFVIGSQIASMIIPPRLSAKRSGANQHQSDETKKQLKKSRRTQNIFMILMCAIVAFSPVGVGVYWFLNSLFSLAQSFIMHAILTKRKDSKKDSIARITNFNI